MMRRFALNLLRLLIGVGFTFSLVLGIVLTMLALFHESGDNLTLNQSGPDWGWGGGAAIAWASTLFCWLGWRGLPYAKPTQMFPMLERWLQAPIVSVVGLVSGSFLAFDMGTKLITHAVGANWLRFWYDILIAVSSGFWAFSSWKQWRKEKQTRNFTGKFYGGG